MRIVIVRSVYFICPLLLLLVFIPVKSNSEDARKEQKKLDRAYQFFLNGNYEKSVQELTLYLDNDEKRPGWKPYMLLGNSYYKLKQYQNAYTAYKKGLKINPDNDELCYNVAVTASKTKQFMLAANMYLKAFRLGHHEKNTLLYASAVCFYKIENYENAYKQLKKLETKSNLESSDHKQLMIQTCIALKYFKKAEVYIQSMLSFNPANTTFWKMLADMRCSSKNYITCASALEAVCCLNPDDTEIHRTLADLYRYLNTPLKAAVILEKISLQADDIETLIDISNLYQKGYKPDKALYYLKKASGISSSEEIYLKMARLSYQLHNYKDTLLAAESCLDLNPINSDAMMIMGSTYMEMNEWQASKKIFMKIPKESENYSMANNHIDVIDKITSAQR